MAYDSRVYRILIASPSDVEEEREVVVRVIQEWNDLYSYSRKVVLLPLRWETHAAPEYGTRPQEVINRATVDQCDMLVGIFWTRIGSPTGVAESGTLEEIERAGNAGKPVMLYFSKVAIDPDTIDHVQNEKLRQFKAKSYPMGLIESYKSIIEFRDKFAKQVELKVRDLQRRDASGALPLSFGFLSPRDGAFVGDSVEMESSHPKVITFDIVPPAHREKMARAVERRIKEGAYLPVVLGVTNSSPSGIRNVYVELDIHSDSEKVEVTESPQVHSFSWPVSWSSTFISSTLDYGVLDPFRENPIAEQVGANLSRFDSDRLQKLERGWRLSIEWDAIQPQRTRLIKPVLYLYAPESTRCSFSARVFADSFPEPLSLSASVSIAVNRKEMELADVLPEWEKLLSEAKSASN